MQLLILPGGLVRCLYDEAIELRPVGAARAYPAVLMSSRTLTGYGTPT